MHILVDFDGTLCPDQHDEEPCSPPDATTLEILRALDREGHRITVVTSRAHDAEAGGWRWRHARRVVHGYLEAFAVPYHGLLIADALYDVVIDRKAVSPDALATLVGAPQTA
jgi:hydroxymethylpyrimidine pyrophosphatase-like HAD family hydrolase